MESEKMYTILVPAAVLCYYGTLAQHKCVGVYCTVQQACVVG